MKGSEGQSSRQIEEQWIVAMWCREQALEAAEDELDARIVRRRLADDELVSGDTLVERLARLETL